jgi:hypothetical protein
MGDYMKISGFMIVRNTLSQGYPFLEAMASALSICDEFLVSDGYSGDGTYEVLVEVSKLNRKIKVYRDPWPPFEKLTVLREATNVLRKRCRGKYIFYVQANEVIHEDSADFIRELPEIWPHAITFSLPYVQLVGTVRFTDQFRVRLAKNLEFIEATADAWTLGLSGNFTRKELVRSMINPKKLRQYMGMGIRMMYGTTPSLSNFTKAIYLPKPIFKYYYLFPYDFIEKIKTRMQVKDFNYMIAESFLKEVAHQNILNPREFFVKTAKVLRDMLEINDLDAPAYPVDMQEIPLDDHPKIVRDLLLSCYESQMHHYYIRDEVIETIKNG